MKLTLPQFMTSRLNKRAAVSTTRDIILIAIALVLFVVITSAVMVKLGFFAETVECNWSLVLNSFQNNEIKCKIRPVTITAALVQSKTEQEYALSRINTFTKEKETAAQQKKPAKYAGVTYFTTTNNERLAEFATDNLVAKELANCWNKALRGSTQGYKWWYHVEPSFVQSKKPAEIEAAIKDGRITSVASGLLQEYGAPTTCMICSQIVFAKDLNSAGVPSQITSMPEFLANNPVLLDSKQRSFYEFLLDGQTRSSKIYLPEYSFHRDVPYAVIYKRIDAQGYPLAGSVISSFVLGGISRLQHALGVGAESPDVYVQTYHSVELVPLFKLREPQSKDPEGGNCVILLNEAQSLGGTS